MYGGEGSAAVLGGPVGRAYDGERAMPSTTAPRVPAVTEQVTALAKRTDQLHGVISALEQRIDPIVRSAPQMPGNAAEKSPAEPGLAGVLREMNQRVEYALARLDSLLNRIEL